MAPSMEVADLWGNVVGLVDYRNDPARNGAAEHIPEALWRALYRYRVPSLLLILNQ